MRLQVTRRLKWVYGLLIGLLLLLGSLYLADHLWRGEVTVYNDDCRQRAALKKRLTAAGVPYRVDERNGIVLGAVSIDEIAKKIGLSGLRKIPTDGTEKCLE